MIGKAISRKKFVFILILFTYLMVSDVAAQSHWMDTISWKSYARYGCRFDYNHHLTGFKHQKTGEILIIPKYSEAGPFAEGKAWVILDGESGYIDKTGKIVINLGNQYDQGEAFSEGLAAVKITGKRLWTYIDTEGNRLNDSLYYSVLPFEGGKAIVKNRQKYGCIDSKGKTVINFDYDYLDGSFADGIFVVYKGDQVGLIDTCENIIFDYGQVDQMTYYSKQKIKCTKNKKIDYLTPDYRLLTGFLYDNVYNYGGQFFVVDREKSNLVDSTGTLLSNIWFDKIESYNKNFFEVRVKNRRMFVNSEGKIYNPHEILPEGYVFRYLSRGMIFARKGDKYGLFDWSGKLFTPELYDQMWTIETLPELILVRSYGSKEKIGFLDSSGRLVNGILYDDISIRGEVIFVKNEGKEGLLDLDGNILAPCIYEEIHFGIHYIPVKQNGKWNFLDRTGEFISEEWYDDASIFSEGLAPVKKNGEWGYLDEQGNVAIPCQFEKASSFKEGIASVSVKASSSNLINKRGQLLFPPGWEEKRAWITEPGFKNGYLAVRKTEKTGKDYQTSYNYIDTLGNFLLPETLPPDFISEFQNGYASITKDHQYTLINTQGKAITDKKFCEVGLISGSIIPVCIESKGKNLWGYIDCNYPDQWFIEPVYRRAQAFSEGLAIVEKDHNYLIIDRNNEIVPTGKLYYKTIVDFSEGLAAAEDYNGKWGFIDISGKYFIEPQFDHPSLFENGRASVVKDGRLMEIDRNGNEMGRILD